MKSNWNEKREKKLKKLYDEFMKDGQLQPNEVQKALSVLSLSSLLSLLSLFYPSRV